MATPRNRHLHNIYGVRKGLTEISQQMLPMANSAGMYAAKHKFTCSLDAVQTYYAFPYRYWDSLIFRGVYICEIHIKSGDYSYRKFGLLCPDKRTKN